MNYTLRTLMLLTVTMLLCSCKVNLYAELDQKEANEMLAVLLHAGIDGEKVQEAESYSLHVEKTQLARAVTVLKAHGYPRETFDSMGHMFQKEGLISSPLEERTRFIYALSQELAATIAQIDGVLASRVHIVLPENNPLNETLHPSSASVFIKYRPGSGVDTRIPQIKQLVTNSIEGLTYDKVTVASFEGSDDALLDEVEATPAASLDRFYLTIGGLTLLLLVLAGFALKLYLAQRSPNLEVADA